MEHLIFLPGESDQHVAETRAAYVENILRTDWISYPSLEDFTSPKTPWLGFEHDHVPLCLTLEEYAMRAHWNTEMLWKGDLESAHESLDGLGRSDIARRCVAFLQSWLYFSFLETVLEKKVNTSYLSRQGPSGLPMLYSRNLHFCLQAMVFRTRLATPETRKKIFMKIEASLVLVNSWATRIAAWSVDHFRIQMDAAYPGVVDLLLQISPSIALLAEAICQTRLYVIPEYPSVIGFQDWRLPYATLERQRQSLKALGWCDFQIELLMTTTNCSTREWTIATGMTQDQTGHETCTSQACNRNDIDNATYQQMHRPNCSGCWPLKPDLGQVRKILDDGKLPVVSLWTGGDGYALHIAAAEKDSAGDYIAFSHVWADGLGGSSETGLWLCQVHHLHHLCSKALGPVKKPGKFWIDCLCIPKEPRETYWKALEAIRDVYLRAHTVIVVDKHIEACAIGASPEHLYATIYMSAWMQRMWTYEEAVLAQKLVFVLRENQFHQFRFDTGPQMRRTVCAVWQSLATELCRIRMDHRQVSIGDIQRAFRWRLCNVPSEEFLSISGILDLETSKLLILKGDMRAREFWLMLGNVPYDTPFVDGPKLDFPGFRWAPRTFMCLSGLTLDTDAAGRKSRCTPDGLVGSYLYVNLDTKLRGRAHKDGSIFQVRISGRNDTENERNPALLRVYCVETWNQFSDGADFDAIVFASEMKIAPEPGRWVPGVGVLSGARDGIDATKTVNGNAYVSFAYVGRVLVEVVRQTEFVTTGKTIMFPGRKNAIIDAAGQWHDADIILG